MRDKELRRAKEREAPDNEFKAIHSFYLPCSYWLEDNKEKYHDPENVYLCQAYDEFRNLVYAELCFDICYPSNSDRSPEILSEIAAICARVDIITRSIESRGNAAMPRPYKWWVDMYAQGLRKARKVSLGKHD